jgi:hypothetical protein
VARAVWAVALASTLVRLAAAAPQGELIDRTLAIVGGQVITLSDVRAAIALGFVEGVQSGDPVAATTKRLIDRALMLREVQRFAASEPSEANIAARVQRIVDRFDSPDRYRATLAALAVSENAVAAWVRDDLRIASYIEQRFAAAESAERRAELVADWIADLRRRTPVIELLKN